MTVTSGGFHTHHTTRLKDASKRFLWLCLPRYLPWSTHFWCCCKRTGRYLSKYNSLKKINQDQKFKNTIQFAFTCSETFWQVKFWFRPSLQCTEDNPPDRFQGRLQLWVTPALQPSSCTKLKSPSEIFSDWEGCVHAEDLIMMSAGQTSWNSPSSHL